MRATFVGLAIVLLILSCSGGDAKNVNNAVANVDVVLPVVMSSESLASGMDTSLRFTALNTFSVEMKYDWQDRKKTKISIFDAEKNEILSIFPGNNYSMYQVLGDEIWLSINNKNDKDGNLSLFQINIRDGSIIDVGIDVSYKFIVSDRREYIAYNYAKKYNEIPGSPGYSPTIEVVRIYNLKTKNITEFDKTLELPYLPSTVDIMIRDRNVLIDYYTDSSVAYKKAKVNIDTLEFQWLK